uniref:Chitin-binding type-2 domain-containing protein n=1 Tax=Strigamia maritima TaxID=126957 RepID=T1JG13_STRMM
MMRVLLLLIMSVNVAHTVWPVNRQLDDSNPEGVAGLDYPTYRAVPRGLTFKCFHRAAGFYADPDTQCQVWHLCDLHGRKHSFLCPNRTMFNQQIRGCDWWYNVDCDGSVALYSNNDDLYRDNRVDTLRIRNPSPPSRTDDDRWIEAVTQAQASSPIPSIQPLPTLPPRRQPAPPQRVTFQVIRRPVTQPPVPTEPPFADPPQQELSGNQEPEKPQTTWQVQFVASNPPPTRGGIRPIPLDNAWRLPQDQERSFPKNPPPKAPTLPPQDNFVASSTRRTPHIVDISSPVSDQSFNAPESPPSPVHSASPSFGARTTATWSSNSQSDFQSSNSVSLPDASTISFKPSFSSAASSRVFSSPPPSISFKPSSIASSPPSSLPPAPVQHTPQLIFGRKTSSQAPFSVSHENTLPETASTFIPRSQTKKVVNRNHPTSGSTFFHSSTPRAFSSSVRVRVSTPAPDLTWSSPSIEVENNQLDQTETNVYLLPEENADPEESDIFRTEVQTTEFYRTFGGDEVTTYHPRNSFAPETAPPITTYAPLPRTSRRRIIKTTKPVIIPTTFRPKPTFLDDLTTITSTAKPTTQRPPSSESAQNNEPEPSVPLAFGARLRPKKVIIVDNAVASSDINQSTLREPESGSVYFPPESDNSRFQDREDSPNIQSN